MEPIRHRSGDEDVEVGGQVVQERWPDEFGAEDVAGHRLWPGPEAGIGEGAVGEVVVQDRAGADADDVSTLGQTPGRVVDGEHATGDTQHRVPARKTGERVDQ